MDWPDYMALSQGWSPRLRSSVMAAFNRLMRGARAVGSASEAMAALVEEQFGQNRIVQMHSLHPSFVTTRAQGAANREVFSIVFAGSLYAKREWNALLSAIAHLGGRIHGRRIEARFIGRFPLLGARKSKAVVEMGRRSLLETLRILAEGDLAYVPYWFDERYALVARTSFPSKIAAYLAAGLPVLFHGPEDAAPAQFLRRYSVGVACHSLDPKQISEALVRADSESTRVCSAEARTRALAEVFSLEQSLSSFARLLDVERGALLPVRACTDAG